MLVASTHQRNRHDNQVSVKLVRSSRKADLNQLELKVNAGFKCVQLDSPVRQTLETAVKV